MRLADYRALPARFRAHLLAAAEAHAGTSPDVALSLSGGVDSATLLFALLALGRLVHCFTFRLGARDSRDSAAARSMAHALGVPWTLVEIPRTSEQLRADVRRVLAITGNARKVYVQCPQPYLHVAPAIAAAGFDRCLVGTAADNLWGTSREVMVAARSESDAEVRSLREQDTGGVVTTSAHTALVARAVAGVELVDPYREHAPLVAFMLDTPYRLLHEPKVKGLAVRAFDEYWSRGRWYRKNEAYQVVSGIRAWHETLLTDPALADLHVAGAKQVVVVYRRLLARMVAAGEAPAAPAIVDPEDSNPDGGDDGGSDDGD